LADGSLKYIYTSISNKKRPFQSGEHLSKCEALSTPGTKWGKDQNHHFMFQ